METWDPDHDGLFEGPQWNTYDCHLFGRNSFVSGLYLAAVRAMEEMSKIQQDGELAGQCRDTFKRGSSRLDGELWGGEYYEQVYDAAVHREMQYGSGCHSDQLLGQWWAHILDLGHILPEDHVRTALKSIHRYNLREDMEGNEQKPRVYLKEDEGGLLICTWPKGGRPDPVTLYSDEVWTGIEYAVAGLMFFEGMVPEGIEIVERARGRHDGRYRSPWNEVECGDHYVRPMSSWSMLEALAGFRYDGFRGRMRFKPFVGGADFRTFFAAGSGWGEYSQERKEGSWEYRVRLSYGDLVLRELALPHPGKAGGVRVSIDGKESGPLEHSFRDGCLVLEGEIQLDRGQELLVTASG
jgi:non-lysosomal glucosylceramidase